MYDEHKELKDFEVESKILESKGDSYRDSFADQITNKGLGDEIIKTLKDPYKITKLSMFKIKVKGLIKNIFDAL